MGILDVSLTLMLSPLILATAVLSIIPISFSHLAPSRKRLRKSGSGRLVLLAVDETSLPALRWSLDQILTPRDFVHVLHILEPSDPPSVFPFNVTTPVEMLDGIKGLGQVMRELKAARVHFDGRVMNAGSGGTADLILQIISNVEPDLVILGSSKRTGPYSPF